MLTALGRLIETNFLIIALLLSGSALVQPELFLWIKPHIAVALGIIMFGMGLTLEFADFKDVLPRKKLLLTGVLLQYTVMPFLGLGFATLFGLPPEAALGLVLVGGMPGRHGLQCHHLLIQGQCGPVRDHDLCLHHAGPDSDAGHCPGCCSTSVSTWISRP